MIFVAGLVVVVLSAVAIGAFDESDSIQRVLGKAAGVFQIIGFVMMAGSALVWLAKVLP